MDYFEKILEKVAYDNPPSPSNGSVTDGSGMDRRRKELKPPSPPKNNGISINTPIKKDLPKPKPKPKPKPGDAPEVPSAWSKNASAWLVQKMGGAPDLAVQPGYAKPTDTQPITPSRPKDAQPITPSVEKKPEKKAEAMNAGELWIYGKMAMEKIAKCTGKVNHVTPSKETRKAKNPW